MQTIVFTGGGSAGHVVPNIALIEELLSKGESNLHYIGTNGIEQGLIAPWQIPFHTLTCPKLIRGGGFKGLKNNIQIPIAFIRAVKQAKTILKQIQPDVVFSKGGYVALPVVAAAKRLHIPCYAHESDYSVGLANKLSAKYCKKIFTSFPETAKKLKRGAYSGSLIRRSVLSSTKAEARKKLNISSHDKVVLIFGGGSGSAKINTAVRKHIKTLCEKYVVIHACGKGNLIESNIKNYRQTEFIEDMATAYACADVIVARAGSGTVFEILAKKKPSVLIPLEGQTRGDQMENAQYFTARGLCHTLFERRLNALPQAIENALLDKEMHARLQESGFTSGNAIVLRALQGEYR